MLRKLRSPILRIVISLAACAGCLSSIICLQRACGEESQALNPGKKDVARNGPSSLFTPFGPPDSTKITGSIENSALPIEQPAVLWKVTSDTANRDGQLTSQPLTNPAVADGILYFGDEVGGLIAYRAHDQTELWTHLHGSRLSMTPSVDRDFVYFGSESGITAIRRGDGKVVWQYPIEHGANEATPIPSGRHLFASGYDGNAYCLSRISGEVVWKHNFLEDAPEDQPGFDGARARFQKIVARPSGSACDGKLFVQCIFDQSRVIALDCETGKRKWTFQTGGWTGTAPTIANERVYVVSQDKHLYCLDLATGVVVWKFETPNWIASRVAVHEEQVFLPHHGGRLYQLAADTGQLIRIMEPPDEADRAGLVASFPIIANKTAYFASENGQFFAFDIKSGQLRWKLLPSEHSQLVANPVTDGRQIFVATRRTLEKTGEHSIVAIGLEP